MTKPNITIPSSFAANGDKTDFDESHITNGFPTLTPDVLRGDNLNKFIDDTYKGLNGVLELYEGCILYDSTVAYNNTSIVFYINSDDEIEIYRSLINNNLNNPLTDTTAWKKVEFDGADKNLSNLTTIGNSRLHALKGYKDEGELLTDSEGLADVKEYAHSSFDVSKFTDIGTPTISSDGILTGSSTNAVSFTNVNFAGATTFDIYGRFTCNDTTVNGQYLFTPTSGFSFSLYINGTTLTTNISSNGTSWNVALYGSVKTITQGTTYDYHINHDGAKYNFYVKEASADTWILEKSYTGGISPVVSSSAIYAIGGLATADRNIHGTVDLKKTFVKLDGVEVFSGNKTGIDTYTIGGSSVSIPYTLSKTGSKIVDSAYRTQVTSVYNEFGCAPYYTLSDTDFTLPQGELYGLMDKIHSQYLFQCPFTVSTKNNYFTTGTPDINNNGFVVSTNSITVPTYGLYFITYAFQKGTNQGGTKDASELHINGTKVYSSIDGGANSNMTMYGSYYANLKTGDLVQLYANNIITSTAADSYIAIRRIGG